MKCSNCGTLNPDGSKYCLQCGNELLIVCPNCGTMLPHDASFCNNCGHDLGHNSLATKTEVEETPLQRFIPPELLSKLEAARRSGSIAGERRVVSMLFCDVQGSTEAAEKLDPEDWSEIMNGAFEYLIAPIYRYEGTLARLMGDGILAFFGAPIAHEDDPQRAVLAGLDILHEIRSYRDKVRDEWGLEFDVRVGINTGLVVVGEVGSDLRMEYSAQGDAINLASRMESTAKPGTIQVSENTHKLIAPLFEFEELGEVKIKGKAAPIKIYRVLGAQEKPGRLRGLEGLEAPLVGRTDEMQTLLENLENLRLGLGQIIFVIGEAGMGKSRLIDEFRSQGTAGIVEPSNGSEIRWSESQSASYETTKPYGQIIQHVLNISGARLTDSASVIKEKVNGMIGNLLEERKTQARSIFEALIGIDQEGLDASLQGEVLKHELFEVVGEMVRSWTAKQPGIMIFDDLHWADAASVDLLQHLFDLTDQIPLLIFAAFRPNRSAASWKAKVMAESEFPHRYTEVIVNPLAEEESVVLVESLMAISHLPDAIRDQIIQITEGNPFFLEEVLRELLERKAVVVDEDGAHWRAGVDIESAQIGIPDNLQALLSARIDRLEEEFRRTLQLAAVIGRRFFFRVLELISDRKEELGRHLGELQRAELIREAARIPEIEYIFRHALTQEVAYKTILRKQRREFHRKVGETIEQLFPERLDEFAGELSEHFYKAADEKALHYCTLAADASFRLYANTEAVVHYARAIEAAVQSPSLSSEQLTHLYRRHGRALELTSRYKEAFENYVAMEHTAQEGDDQPMVLSALMLQGQIRTTPNELFDADKGKSLADKALALAHELDDAAAEAKIMWTLLNMYHFQGKVQEALKYGERSLELARKNKLKEQLAYTLNDIYHVYSDSWQTERALEVVEEASKLWKELNNLPMLTDSLASITTHYVMQADIEAAAAYSEEGYQLSESIGNLWGQSYSKYVIGMLYWERGEPGRAIEAMQTSIEYGQKAGFIVPLIFTRGMLAAVYASLGAHDRGLENANLALSISAEKFQALLPIANTFLARVHLLRGDLPEAMAAIGKIDTERNPISYVIDLYILGTRASIALKAGEFDQALQMVEEGLDILGKTGAPLMLPEHLLFKSLALSGLGRQDEAYGSFEEGRAKAEELGLNWISWQVLAQMAAIETTRGNEVKAASLRQQSRSIIHAIADNIAQDDLRTSFLALPEIEKLLS